MIPLLLALAAAAPADTLRGRVTLTDEAPALLTPEGRTPLSGPLVSVLRRVAGLEVMVAGGRDASGAFRVERFLVRAAGGDPVEDGELTREGDRYLLLTEDGRRLPLDALPAALRDRAGWRVWIAGPIDHPAAFGIVAQLRRPEE